MDLFNKYLITFTKCINQVTNVVKKKSGCSRKALTVILELKKLLPLMEQVYDFTWRKQINGE